MQWRHHDEIVTCSDHSLSTLARGRLVIERLGSQEPVDRLVLEGHLGTDRLPSAEGGSTDRTSYAKAWVHGQPILLMTVSAEQGTELEEIHAWFSPEAHAAWRYYVDHDRTILPPRKVARVYETGDEITPYVILGHRIRRWNASQDLPKQLVGATSGDPDGNAFLSRLGRRWRRMNQSLVAETVKEAMRPVPEATSSRRYATCPIGEGQMIRYGKNGEVWVDAEGVVHLARLAGYPLGYPNEISDPNGGDGWRHLDEIIHDPHELAARLPSIVAETKRTEYIPYDAFVRETGTDILKRLFPEYRWGRGGRHGERLRDDPRIQYQRLIFRGHPAIAITVKKNRRLEIWMSSSAQASLIDMMNGGQAETVDEPRLRKRQRKALMKFVQAVERLKEEGLELVLQGSVLKVRLEGQEGEKKRIIPIFSEDSILPDVK